MSSNKLVGKLINKTYILQPYCNTIWYISIQNKKICIYVLYMYVNMYVCMYICMYVYMHVCMYVYMYVYTVCMNEWMYVCMYKCMYIFNTDDINYTNKTFSLCTCIYVCSMYVCLYVRKYACMLCMYIN